MACLLRRFRYVRGFTAIMRVARSTKAFEMADSTPAQTLHLVMGGRVIDPRSIRFQDPESIHVVGVFSDYDAAVEAWRANAQRTVDDAEMKYVIVPLHDLLTPEG